jgi:hypothetical protein
MMEQQSRQTHERVDGIYQTALTIDKISVLNILENIKKIIEHNPELGMEAIKGCIEGLEKELRENKEIQ